MESGGQRRRIGASCWLAVAVATALALALPSPLRADVFDKALAEIDQALEANPNHVSPDSIRSCRAMRNTAILLREMGQYERAVRRLKMCRKLLGLDDYESQRPADGSSPWPA